MFLYLVYVTFMVTRHYFLDRLGFQYKLNGDDRSVPNDIYVFIFFQLLTRKAATIGRKVYFHTSCGHTSLAGVKVDT